MIAAAYREQFLSHPAKLNQHPKVIKALADVGRRLKAAVEAA